MMTMMTMTRLNKLNQRLVQVQQCDSTEFE